MLSIEERFNNDPMVRNMVLLLYTMIKDLKMTPTEIRECAMLAATMYERERPLQHNIEGE
jgi:hypothetical protein